MTEGGRPQDQGRRHRAKGSPSPETRSLLESYQRAMRDELRGLLAELEGKPAPAGLLDEGRPGPVVRPVLEVRAKLWDLAFKLGRELGAEVDVPPPPAMPNPATPGRRRRARPDFGP